MAAQAMALGIAFLSGVPAQADDSCSSYPDNIAPTTDASIISCMNTADGGWHSLENVFGQSGVDDPKDPCKVQKVFDAASHTCETVVKDLHGMNYQRTQVLTNRCKGAQSLAKLPSPCTSASCLEQKASLNNDSIKYNNQESCLITQMQSKLADLKKLSLEMAQGAADLQKDAQNKAASNPNGTDVKNFNDLKNAAPAAGSSVSSNRDAANFFKDDVGAVEQAISAVKQPNASASSISGISTPLTKEPLALAVSSDQWSAQMNARQTALSTQSGTFKTEAASTTGSAEKLSSLDGSSATSTAAAAAPLAGAASSLASAGGSGSSASDSASPSSAGTQLASAASPTSTGSYVPGGGQTGTNSLAASTTPSSAGGANNTSLQNTQVASTDTTQNGTSASQSLGSSLRSALRDRMASSGGYGSSSTGASTSPATPVAGSGANASSGAVPADLLPQAKATPAEDPLAAAASATGGDLGNTNFSMAGSDTESAVKNMLKEFGPTDSGASRSPASTQNSAPEILARDSSSLFLRARETHLRCLKKGLVINGLRAKL